MTLWEIIQVVYDNYISKNGDVRRKVRVGLKSNKDDLTHYTWHIPIIKEKQKVRGMSVHDTEGLLSYDINEEKDVTILTIDFSPLSLGEEKTLFIEYYVTDYSTIIKRGLISKTWRYSWNYKILSNTEKFKTNIYLPSDAVIKNLEANTTDNPIQFRYNNEHIVIMSEHKEIIGDLFGEIDYVFTPMRDLFFGVFIGAITTKMRKLK
jgi:hypothetical protein